MHCMMQALTVGLLTPPPGLPAMYVLAHVTQDRMGIGHVKRGGLDERIDWPTDRQQLLLGRLLREERLQ